MEALKQDELFATRFRIVSQIGLGGMGTIHHAVDVVTGQDVALKRMIQRTDGANLSRFLREAQLLSRLEHPNIVRYVAHDPHHDPPWLAMEWLRGADLSAYIGRGPMPVPAALALAADLAGALGKMHSVGLVHRDLKPANVFVVEEEGALRARLLDLGVARDVSEDATLLTSAGTLIGTPLYMSPEQARGADLDARSDLWSLGVVLFEMLTGRSPYASASPIAVLAKILVGDVPRLSSARSDISATLDDLVAQMLTRDREDRPPNTAEVELRLRSIGSAQPQSHVGVRSLRETRLHFVLMVIPSTASHGVKALEALRKDGARVERTRDGTIVALYGAERSSTDDALRCARSGLALRSVDPQARIALALSRGELTGGAPDALERAASLLQGARPGELATDATTVGVIGEQAQWTTSDGRTLLVGLASATASTESSLIVGREAELGALEGLCRSAWQEQAAVGALVVGEPGVGKSTLLTGLVRRIAGADDPPMVITCSADTRTAGVPYAVVGRALRAVAGLHGGATAEADKRSFAAWAEGVLGAQAGRELPFLYEMIGLRQAAETLVEGPILAPERLRAELGRAWALLLRKLASQGPVLLLAEDLQWADHASANLLLRTLDIEAPIALVASVRSEARESQREFLEHPNVKEIPLRGLSPRASERLLRRLLPKEADALASLIVARAGGNPLFLRELARVPQHGTLSELPESLELVVQQRFDALAAPVREVARVAAAFGDTAYVEGVRYVLDRDVRADIAALVSNGILESGATGTIPTMTEVRFRHSFLRETAERMTVRDDALTYHERIYGWLAHLGAAVRPQVLARHAEVAGRHAEALGLYTSGAASAARVFQLEDAAALSVRALRVAVSGRLPVSDVLAMLDALDTHLQTVRMTDGALEALKGTLAYVDEIGTTRDRARARVSAASVFGAAFEYDRANAMFDEAASLLEGHPAQLRELYLRRAGQAVFQGSFDAADRYMARVDELLSDEPPTLGLLLRHALVAASLDDFARADDFLSRAKVLADNDVDTLALLKITCLRNYLSGDLREAYKLASRAIDVARQLGLTFEVALQLHNAGDVASQVGEAAATELLEESLRLCVIHGFRWLERHNRAYLSYLAVCEREDDSQLAAIAQAQERMVAEKSYIEAVTNGLRLARAYRLRGRASEAMRTANATLAIAERCSFLRIRRELRALLDELQSAGAA